MSPPHVSHECSLPSPVFLLSGISLCTPETLLIGSSLWGDWEGLDKKSVRPWRSRLYRRRCHWRGFLMPVNWVLGNATPDWLWLLGRASVSAVHWSCLYWHSCTTSACPICHVLAGWLGDLESDRPDFEYHLHHITYCVSWGNYSFFSSLHFLIILIPKAYMRIKWDDEASVPRTEPGIESPLTGSLRLLLSSSLTRTPPSLTPESHAHKGSD